MSNCPECGEKMAESLSGAFLCIECNHEIPAPRKPKPGESLCPECNTPFSEHPASRCLDVAVARAMGWTDVRTEHISVDGLSVCAEWTGKPPNGIGSVYLPHFSTDGNAMLDAMEGLRKNRLIEITVGIDWFGLTLKQQNTEIAKLYVEADTLPLVVARAVAGMKGDETC